jgi:signal transduction histidine kinase
MLDILLKNLGSTYNVIGHNLISQGNYSEGLRVSFLALEIREKMGNKKGISDTEYNIGNIYLNQNNYQEALKHYDISLQLSEELDLKDDIAWCTNTMGLVYFRLENYAQAHSYYTTALKVAEEIKEDHILGQIYNNLGLLHSKQGNHKAALKYHFDALKLHEQVGVIEQIPEMHVNIALIYIKQKKFDDAKQHADKALQLSKASGSLEYLKLSYETRATLDSALGKYQDAFNHYKLGITFRDSVFNKENAKKQVQQQMQYDFDKKEDSLKQQQIITETKLTAQKGQRYFYWVGLAMLSALSFFVFLNFRNQKKINRLASEAHTKQKADLELQHVNAVMQERLRISRELHDEVGATLSGIAMYSHLAKEQIKNNKTTEVEKSLTIMQQSSGEMVNKLNDIVWLVNPEQDSLQKLIERLEEYARNMASIKNMLVKINVPEKVSQLNLPVESRRNIYLFCKEAINNAVKYSGGNLLELNIKEEDGKLEFSVSDNGQGFDAVMVRRGNGLENMQKRADEVGAKLVLSSKENGGTSLLLVCKITG